jgi:hypothetical protein
MISQEEQNQHDAADMKDQKLKDENAEIVKSKTPNGIFMRLYDLAHPKSLVVLGILGGFLIGANTPIWAIFYSRAIEKMTVPLELIEFVFADEMREGDTAKDFFTLQINWVIIAALLIGLFSGYGFKLRV